MVAILDDVVRHKYDMSCWLTPWRYPGRRLGSCRGGCRGRRVARRLSETVSSLSLHRAALLLRSGSARRRTDAIDSHDVTARGHSIGWGNREVQTWYEIQFYCFFVVSLEAARGVLPPPQYLAAPRCRPTPSPQLFQFIAFRGSTMRPPLISHETLIISSSPTP